LKQRRIQLTDKMEPHDMNEFLATANEALAESGATIKRYFRQQVRVESKADATPVTIVDQTAEAQIRKVINRRHPDHGIFGEEHGIDRSESHYEWVIDPIDGTKSFISGMPIFGTLLGLTYQSSAKIGVIDMPILNERWVGAEGQVTTHNGSACKVSAVQTLEQATLYCTEPEMFDPIQLQRFELLSEQVKLRRFGGDCYCYGLLASGQIDLVVEGRLHFYDIMALIPVIEGAGGVISGWDGQSLQKDGDGLVIAAATPRIHEATLEILARPSG